MGTSSCLEVTGGPPRRKPWSPSASPTKPAGAELWFLLLIPGPGAAGASWGARGVLPVGAHPINS